MDILTIIPALIFALTGLVAIWIIGKAILTSLAGDLNLLGRFKKRKLTEKSKILDKAKELLEAQNIESGSKLLEQAYFLDPPMVNLNFLEAVHDHNFDTLAITLQASKTMGRKLQSLPELERLLQNRMQLQRSLAENYLSLDLIKSKRKTEGKETPSWAINEFKKKIESVLEDLNANKKEITACISVTCGELIAMSKPDNNLSVH